MKISVRDLHKSYRDASRELTVIDSLSYEFAPRGSIAIIGRSGTGKSTLLHLLGGLDRPGRGKVFYDDSDLFSLGRDKLSSFRGANIGFIFQFHHLLPEFDAVENVAMPLIVGGEAESTARFKASQMLEKVGLSQRMTHRPGQLSGGEQQRVAIARAIVTRPKVLLADEPTGNLDFKTAREVQGLLLDLNRELGNVMIVVTHNLELARTMDHALEMAPGGYLSSFDAGSPDDRAAL